MLCLTVQVVYRMTQKVRGRAVIISNQYFSSSRHRLREGTEFDEENVCSLFSQLGFEPEVYRNKERTVSRNYCFVHRSIASDYVRYHAVLTTRCDKFYFSLKF
jgi:hypothetical protein